jgi:hypothetical protein
LSKYDFRSGSFSEDSRGRWYFNVVVEYEIEPSIGTTSVGVPLEVRGAKQTIVSTDNGVLNIVDSSGFAANSGGSLVFRGIYNSAGASAGTGFIDTLKDNGTDGNYSYAMTFGSRSNGSSSTERMRIASSGNVGIGTTAPNSNSRLHVYRGGGSYDTIIADGDAGTNTGFAIYEAGTSKYALYSNGAGGDDSFNIYNFAASSNSLTILAGGNVGIGTTTPSTNLQLGRVFGFVQDINSGYIQANMASNGNYLVSQFATRIHLDSALGEIKFLNAASGTAGNAITMNERMRITSGGVVTIGKDSQSGNAALTVKSPAGGNTGIILIEGDTTNNGWGMYAVTTDEFRVTRFTNGSYSDKLVIADNGQFTLSNSTGIRFAGGSSNLNYYEEGTWTPSIVGGGGGEATYPSLRLGWYTRIGRSVTITWFVSITKNNMSGGLRMTGLPFTLLAGSAHYPQGTVLLDNLSTATNNITFQAATNTTTGDFIGGNGSTSSHTGLPTSVLGSGTMECRGTVTYFV